MSNIRLSVSKLMLMALFASVLSACGGGGGASIDGGTPATSQSVMASSIVTTSNAASSVVTGKTGAEYWADLNCAVCHGDKGVGGTGGALNSVSVNVCSTCGNEAALAAYIQTYMPQGKVGTCDANCGQVLAS